MADMLQSLLSAGVLPATDFPPTSRYAGVPVDVHDRGDGSPSVPFLRRRLCPRPERFALLLEVVVGEGDRRDLLAARHLGDPELWWRLADANGIVDPRDLTSAAGGRLRVTLDEGVAGRTDA